MQQFETVNGWTKEQMIRNIELRFKGQAYNSHEETCEYLTSDGRQCAVGMFIPVPLIKEIGIDKVNVTGGVNSLFRAFPDMVQLMPLTPDGMYAFQEFHDRPSYVMGEQIRLTTERMVQWVKENVK